MNQLPRLIHIINQENQITVWLRVISVDDQAMIDRPKPRHINGLDQALVFLCTLVVLILPARLYATGGFFREVTCQKSNLRLPLPMLGLHQVFRD
jgi:hypothetical protein